MVRDDGQFAVPVLLVADVRQSLLDYRRLGFTARIDERGAYGYLRRGGIRLQVARTAELLPHRPIACYLYVSDADVLAAEWQAAEPAGTVVAPEDKPWRMREGSYTDVDGNVLRFGNRLPLR